MGISVYQGKLNLTQPAAEEALRGYAAGRSGFDYGLARDLELLISALRAAHNEAKAANQAKSAFLAFVSHELRTPLNAIIGFAEMISAEQLGPHADKRYADYAKDIAKGARQLSGILGDIIDMARLENGRLKAQRDTFVFKDLMEEVRAISAARFKSGSAPIETAIAPEFPETVWTDKARLRQILLNLLSNALAYTPSDGRVTLSATVTANGDPAISVSDSGQGMSPADLKRALTRFGHVEDEGSREGSGIGLGLPLAKALTELLGGEMTIQSAPGEGTTVTLRFPSNSIRADNISWGRPADRMAERAKRILGEENGASTPERDPE